MSVAGAGWSVKLLLERRFAERAAELPTFTFDLFTTEDFGENIDNTVSVFVYRVDVDPTRRHHERAPTTVPRGPSTHALSLEIRLLLTVWAQNAQTQLRALQACMEILEENPVLSGDLLSAEYRWEPDTALRVVLESISTEDMMRIWDSLSPPYHLSVPYVLRPVKLAPVERPAAPPVESRTNAWSDRVPRRGGDR